MLFNLINLLWKDSHWSEIRLTVFYFAKATSIKSYMKCVVLDIAVEMQVLRLDCPLYQQDLG